MPSPTNLLDPVTAYDRLAPFFPGVARRRSSYLRSIEDLIVGRAGQARSLLDVGAGDGDRALRIADRLGIGQVVLVEPSGEMSRRAGGGAEVWPFRAEDLDAGVESRRFDVVTCLWNVLGHVRPEEARVRALEQIGRLLTAEGRLFLDVNHRYNLRSYGVLPTLARLAGDLLSPGEARGDVTVRWDLEDGACSTYGHVFTNGEMRRLAGRAGLVVEERVVVDYEYGLTRRWTWQGSLLYVFRRRSAVT